tara:strand:- start:569 stop:730 length:162 start_codon:yes stop_codon:yes gene_type:complete
MTMACPTCSTPLIWGGDHSYEDYDILDEKGIVSNLACPNEKCNLETVITYSKL